MMRLPGIVAIWGLLALLAPPHLRADLVTTYRFNNSFQADESNRPELGTTGNTANSMFEDAIVYGQTQKVFRFASASEQQVGLTLDITPDSPAVTLAPNNNYSIEMVFSFDSGSGIRRLLNARAETNDKGLYINSSNQLELFADEGQEKGNDTISANTYHHVVLTVEARSGTDLVKLYLDGQHQDITASNGPNGNALDGILSDTMDIASPADRLLFFQDNGAEYSNGRVALIRLYDTVLTGGQVASSYSSLSAVPEPSVVSLMLIATTAVGFYVTRLRRSARSL